MRISNGFLGSVSSISEMNSKFPPDQYAGAFINLMVNGAAVRYISSGSEWRVLTNYSVKQQQQLDTIVRNGPVLAQASQAAQGDALIWWPLRENVATSGGSIVVSDYSGQHTGTISGGTRRWKLAWLNV